MVCLETSFLIDFLRGEPRAVHHFETLVKIAGVTVAAPTIMEITTGAALNESRQEREKLNEFLSSITVLPLDREAALHAGDIAASLILAGEHLEAMDIQIGSIAAVNGQSLVTANVKHFSRIPGLIVQSY